MKIERIDIANFGSFQNLNWNNDVRDRGNNRTTFKKLNIIYGHNYAGKTTLSRILRSLQMGKLPENYHNAQFTVFGDGGEVSENQLLDNSYNIRVYNQDFVRDNLSFLTNEKDGNIQTFAIIGDKNNEIEKKIQSLEMKLGSIESCSGLYFDEQVHQKQLNDAKNKYEDNKSQLHKLLTQEARAIKENTIVYQDINYNITKISRDIEKVKQKNIKALSCDEENEKKALLAQTALSEIAPIKKQTLAISSISQQANEILNRKIQPTKAINDLLNDALLQNWVKSGMDLHRDKRDTCAFCQQSLPSDIWQQLDTHFNKESSILESDINSCLKAINLESQKINGMIELSVDSFYVDNQTTVKQIKQKTDEYIDNYQNFLNLLKSELEERLKNLFQSSGTHLVDDSISTELFFQYIEELNKVIELNNSKTNNLDSEKAKIREELRLSHVQNFMVNITYDSRNQEIETSKNIWESISKQLGDISSQILSITKEIDSLRSQLQDEKKGAERVNTLLNQFFGHEEISLKVSNDSAVTFQITRNDSPAYNLSEGERSLIAFCYFMAKLEDIDSSGKDLIIYIDDPISSLDNNHVFFVYSLIEQLLAKYKKYEQLFISTHNLDFLKYLKRLTIPKEKIEGSTKEDCEYFLIQRKNGSHISKSSISIMPSYLRKYITEFNYLFHQIYRCQPSKSTDENDDDRFYSFGNNLRKFLESYLFFKYPCHGNIEEKIRKFLSDDILATRVNRVVNEFSHLEEIFDRSLLPIDIPEMQEIAKNVLEKIEEVDKEQYDSLVKSIQKDL